jgi:hypothetical protein
MAKFQAIAATGQAILGLLADSCPRPEFAGARFELYQAGNFLSPMEEGVSLFLYRVGVNGALRNHPASVGLYGERSRPPLPLDLYYVMTAWAKTAVKQQRLLGWAMRTLEDTPILPASLLNHYGPEADVFKPHETVEFIIETLTLQDLSNLWNAIKINPPLSIPYVARIIGIEAPMTQTEAALVQTREFEMAKV